MVQDTLEAYDGDLAAVAAFMRTMLPAEEQLPEEPHEPAAAEVTAVQTAAEPAVENADADEAADAAAEEEDDGQQLPEAAIVRCRRCREKKSPLFSRYFEDADGVSWCSQECQQAFPAEQAKRNEAAAAAAAEAQADAAPPPEPEPQRQPVVVVAAAALPEVAAHWLVLVSPHALRLLLLERSPPQPKGGAAGERLVLTSMLQHKRERLPSGETRTAHRLQVTLLAVLRCCSCCCGACS